jgi:ribose transport system substrate-binding protein
MKKLVLIVLLIVVALPLAVSVKAQEQPLKITFVTHDLGAGVFAPVRKGMEDACKAVNAECEFLGPQSYNPEEQVKILEAVVAKKPDGMPVSRL